MVFHLFFYCVTVKTIYLEKLLKSKTAQLVTIKVDDYVTRDIHVERIKKQTSADGPAGRPRIYFRSPEAKC